MPQPRPKIIEDILRSELRARDQRKDDPRGGWLVRDHLRLPGARLLNTWRNSQQPVDKDVEDVVAGSIDGQATIGVGLDIRSHQWLERGPARSARANIRPEPLEEMLINRLQALPHLRRRLTQREQLLWRAGGLEQPIDPIDDAELQIIDRVRAAGEAPLVEDRRVALDRLKRRLDLAGAHLPASGRPSALGAHSRSAGGASSPSSPTAIR